jgi:hypothetical protein
VPSTDLVSSCQALPVIVCMAELSHSTADNNFVDVAREANNIERRFFSLLVGKLYRKPLNSRIQFFHNGEEEIRCYAFGTN